MNATNIPIGPIVRENLTVEMKIKVTGAWRVTLRFWLADKLLRLAAFVMPGKGVVSIEVAPPAKSITVGDVQIAIDSRAGELIRKLVSELQEIASSGGIMS